LQVDDSSTKRLFTSGLEKCDLIILVFQMIAVASPSMFPYNSLFDRIKCISATELYV
jgi:hypothetical protein